MKKKILITLGALACLLALWAAWSSWLSSTRIAFVNYQVTTLGEISKANDNSHIKLRELSTDDLSGIGDYDMVFINAMGLRITQEQRQMIQDAADRGLPVMTTAATNPENSITSIDSTAYADLRGYLFNGGRRNYRSMLAYVRKNIDCKRFFVSEPDSLIPRSTAMIYHADPDDKDGEELGFGSVAEYEAFLKRHGLYPASAPRVIVTGQMGEPSELIARLEATGNIVYPVRSLRTLIEGHHIDSISPSAVINMAHGRLGDYAVDYLTRQNIPLFAPLNVNRLVSEWEDDKMGMSGGFLSQSVVTPEIDGAIRPFALFGNYPDEDGLQHTRAIPGRLETFVETVNNYISLKSKPNSKKRIAIYYYKGPGQNALTAAGMEVGPSLYNVLLRLKSEGYNVDGLPSSAATLERMIQSQGAVFSTYAEGAFDEFMRTGRPALVTKEEYESWVKEALTPKMYEDVIAGSGEFPGSYMATGDGRLGVARLEFGNVVLLPQPMAGSGDNAFQIVHGTDAAPPHTYIASYLWARYGFHADAIIHLGTHGSLEFTPKKQVALSDNDWPDRLVGAMPHFYIYSISDVGEGMTAKRRSYAGLQSYLTPPFLESGLRGTYSGLSDAVREYDALMAKDNPDKAALKEASLKVKRLAVRTGIHRDLGLDSVLSVPYSQDDISRIENFAEEIAMEKITGQLYTMGVPYESGRITSSVLAMATDPIAYSLYALDRQKGKASSDLERHKSRFTSQYIEPARSLATSLLGKTDVTDDDVCRIAGITKEELSKAREIDSELNGPRDMMSIMMSMASQMPSGAASHADTGKPSSMHERMKKMGKGMDPKTALKMAKMMGASPEALKKMEEGMKKKDGGSKGAPKPAAPSVKRKEYTKKEKDFAQAVMEVERTVRNVSSYRRSLQTSPEAELASLVNALSGGYTEPSPGGDPVANPNVLPTGRNLFAINAEETPTEQAWEKGKALAESTISMYRKRHNDSIPRKVSYTLWSGEFIETGGATIAQVLYMLGVEPVRDTFGRVTDLRLIPSKELGRPRIDVVVQTSGQLRDIAASRLFLITRAVEMAAEAKDDGYENMVAEGVRDAERVLVEKGVSPKEARQMSTYRVFGGAGGNYGTGIQGMVKAGDRWESEDEIAEVYLNNMGASYGSEKDWEQFRQHVFEAALTNTDAVVQPRQSNTWGALSLDHVYEFMGGMDLAVRSVTGKDPDAFMSDYRNRNNARMQEVKEAIGVESRSTLFNPTYIKEKMKGEASAAGTFAELIENTYGWNVMKPSAIDGEMWDEIYNVYVKDKFSLGVREFFEDKNPAAMQQMTAVMMETARKGYWKATTEQLSEIASLHTDLVRKYGATDGTFASDNRKLQDFIASKVDPSRAAEYKSEVGKMRESAATADKKGVTLKKDGTEEPGKEKSALDGRLVVAVVIVALLLILMVLKRRRR